MKFVHLTSQPNIGRVKRSGIRTGNGRRGRGVYAVPLMMMEQVALVDEDEIIAANPRSSTTLWRWLRKLKSRHSHVAAIIFRTTSDHWPAKLYVELRPITGIEWLSDIDAQDATAADADIAFVRQIHSWGFIADFKLSVKSPNGLGKIMHAIHSRGHRTLDCYDESVEVVFPAPIPPHLIEQVTPFYRTNKQFKQKRERQHDFD